MTIYRKTLDANREINKAAQECPNDKAAYNNYHNKIRSIISGFFQGKRIAIGYPWLGLKISRKLNNMVFVTFNTSI